MSSRLRVVCLVLLAALVATPFYVWRAGPLQLPGAVLASGSDFSISGSVSSLAPGASSPIVLTVDNPQTVPLTVTQVTVMVTPDPGGCSALSNLTLNGTSFTGNPPSVTISGSPLPQTVPAKSGSSDGVTTLSVPVLVARASLNACQTITFPFVYSARATYTAATATTLTSSPNPSNFGQPATFTATIAASPSSSNPAVGTVTFYRCTNPANLAAGSAASACTSQVALAGPQTVNGSGQATLTTSSLPSGTSPIYAVFSPTDSSNYTASSSKTLTQTVGFTQPCVTSSVSGGYTVGSGQSICMTGSAKVNGGLTVQSGGSLYLNGGTVNGGLNANHAGAIQVCGSTVNGGATITGSTGFVMLGDGADDGTPACAANSISGGVTVSNGTGSFEVAGNSITGGATFSGNTGTGPYSQDATPEIEGNHINGGLSCSTNNPAPSNGAQANSVSGSRSGQCSAGTF